ncbi:hypothetical protein KUCAC02_023772 [Chaenocephalus aceratus]|uniref:Uncharacterized protein n=1 Tax=Chaenocephalus aceratus TaxID=36190 RepID=A0ACB9WGH2_CHAAC|nr:hypothetical protein KUCAC02_023772 [Chaenocephalus aceratus]
MVVYSTNEQRFVLLLRKMLHLNLRRRTTPSDALLDPFITGLDAVDSLVEESSEEDNGYAGDGDSPAVDTSEGASSDMSSIDVACAATVDSFVGVENVAVVFSIDEASVGAPVSTDDTMTVVPNKEVSAPRCFTVQRLLGGGDSNRATTVLYDAVTADRGTAAADKSAPAMTRAALKSPSTDEGSSPPSTADAHIGSGGVSARNSQGKRIRKFFVRMFRALSGCCSANVEQ